MLWEVKERKKGPRKREGCKERGGEIRFNAKKKACDMTSR